MRAEPSNRLKILLSAVGLDANSFDQFLEWTLAEHLVTVLSGLPELSLETLRMPDGLRRFRDAL